MHSTVDYDEMDAALRRCGSTWNAAQAHGLLCSSVAVMGSDSANDWLHPVLENTAADDPARRECATLLGELFATTGGQLAERQSEFTLLLPGDSVPVAIRAEEMARWCEGFLHGLVSRAQAGQLRRRLAEEPLCDVIRDMLQITRASAGAEAACEAGDFDAAGEADEAAYNELLEYLRVAVQLVYEELAELRAPAAAQQSGNPGILH